MSVIKISKLPPASLPLVGADFVPVVQNGTTSRTTLSALSNYLNVKNFGAVGDGTTDDTAAIQAALNYVAANQKITGSFYVGGSIYIPFGRYKISSQLVFTGGSISIYGDGPFSSSLFWTAAGGISITLISNECRVNFTDLDLQAATSNAGTALSIVGVGAASSNFQNAYLNNVYFWSDYGTSYWTKAIDFQDIWHFVLDSVFFKGATDPTYWGDFVTLKGKSIDGRILNCYAYGANRAVYVNSSTLEGLRIDNCSFVAVNRGVYKPTSSGNPPHYTIRGSHIAAAVNCIELNNTSSVIISDNLLYLGPQASIVVPNNSSCIYISNCFAATIVDNICSGRENPIPNTRYGIVFTSTVFSFNVNDNYLDLFTYGVWVQTGNTGPGIIGNIISFGVTNLILDQSTSNVVVTKISSVLNLNQKQTNLAAVISTDQTNQTGDSTVAAIQFTKLCDTANNYPANNGVVNIAINGTYEISATLLLKNIGGSNVNATLRIVAGANTYDLSQSATTKDSTGALTIAGNTCVNLTAGQTIIIYAIVSGSTKTVSVGAGTSLSVQMMSD
jgi:hypothetical protein